MTKRKLQKIKSLLTKSIKAHLKNGGKLIADDFYLGSMYSKNASASQMCKCPVQVVVDNLNDRETCPVKRVATSAAFSSALGFHITRDEMFAIISGYDKSSKTDMNQWMGAPPYSYKELYEIGYQLRKSYKPLTKPQINKIMGYDYV